ncbi:MAG TPA: phosphopyruvate hydratase [Caulobacteraceae bacterium]|nr:phosphopyruvate hydratase [Caulobacteraceae bacterium]
MSATAIHTVFARQILDSRGRPTVEAEVALAGGASGRASAPSGASRGAAEAFELRDGDPDCFEGRGVIRAVAGVNGEIAALLASRDALDQRGADQAMRELDGTAQLSRLGGNAILAVSIAVARAGAAASGQPLYRRLADLSGVTEPTMPMPMVNILSGGLHAGRGMDVQDFLVIPIGATSYGQALEWALRVRAAASALCQEMGLPTLLADEGGLSPGFAHGAEALALMVRAVERAGLRPGEDAAIALDIAASALTDAEGPYVLQRAGRTLDSQAMIGLLTEWAARFPIVSIEDGLGEEDWSAWPDLTRRLGHIQLVGDDLFATQADRIARGVREGAGNAALIKINQNGTLSGTLDALAAARAGAFATVISARSGETEDAFIADLAVGVAGGQIKIGSVRTSERMAKYNQLLRLDEEGLPFAGSGFIRR